MQVDRESLVPVVRPHTVFHLPLMVCMATHACADLVVCCRTPCKLEEPQGSRKGGHFRVWPVGSLLSLHDLHVMLQAVCVFTFEI
jgi:hypothetical protein